MIMVKQQTIKSLKTKTWKAFSLYIRLSVADEYGFVTCITCGTKKHYKNLQAGHFVPGRGNSILFEERGVHPQCYHCNIGLKGNPRKYAQYMLEKYGQGVIDELDRLSETVRKFTPQELIELREYYKQKTARLGGHFFTTLN